MKRWLLAAVLCLMPAMVRADYPGRVALLTDAFGQQTLPTYTATISNVSSPQLGVSADSIKSVVYSGNTGFLYESATPNGKLFVIHQGHDNIIQARGLGELAQSCVDANVSVYLVGMLGYAGNSGGDHNSETSLGPFLQHMVAAMNSLSPSYSQIAMTGLSGGGWTTTVYSAIDDRIDLSIEVAGSLPWSRRTGYSLGDFEQSYVSEIVPYMGLYALATTPNANGPRTRIQILNRDDSNSFSRYVDNGNGAYGDDYPALIADLDAAVSALHGGTVEFVEDTSHASHIISPWARSNVILPALGITAPETYDVTIDNTDDECIRIGPTHPDNTSNAVNGWTHYTTAAQGVGGTIHGYLATAATPSDAAAEWFFLDAPPGTYNVIVSWSRYSNRATAAKYEIESGENALNTFTLNQSGATNPLVTSTLGQVSTAVDGIVVRLVIYLGQNGYAMADSVRLERVQ